MSADKKVWSNDPAAEQNNVHHSGGYRDEQDWMENSGFKGTSDPDELGYPGEDEVQTDEHSDTK